MERRLVEEKQRVSYAKRARIDQLGIDLTRDRLDLGCWIKIGRPTSDGAERAVVLGRQR